MTPRNVSSMVSSMVCIHYRYLLLTQKTRPMWKILFSSEFKLLVCSCHWYMCGVVDHTLTTRSSILTSGCCSVSLDTLPGWTRDRQLHCHRRPSFCNLFSRRLSLLLIRFVITSWGTYSTRFHVIYTYTHTHTHTHTHRCSLCFLSVHLWALSLNWCVESAQRAGMSNGRLLKYWTPDLKVEI